MIRRTLALALLILGLAAPVRAQAPTIASTGYLQGYGSTTTVNVTLTSGFTAGNTVLVGIMQFSSTKRDITSISDGTNSYVEVISNTGSSYSFSQIYVSTNVGAVAASGTLTVEFDNNQDGYVFVQEISPATVAGVTGSAIDLVGAGTTYLSASPGVTTAGNVFLFAVGGLSGGSPNRIPIGAGWVSLIDGSSNDVAFFMYQRSDSAIGSADTGPWAGDNARAYSGVVAAFYASGGGGGLSAPKTLLLMGAGGGGS